MEEHPLDFGSSMEGINYRFLLEEAAKALEKRKDMLGTSYTKTRTIREGTLVR